MRASKRAHNDMGKMYRILREIGAGQSKTAPATTTITTGQFKKHFEKLSSQRFERRPQEIERAAARAEDKRRDPEAIEANQLLNETPQEEEIIEAIKYMKDGAPGEDNLRISYIREAHSSVKLEVVKAVQVMFEYPAEEWDTCLKTGMMCPIFKKGDKTIPGTTEE